MIKIILVLLTVISACCATPLPEVARLLLPPIIGGSSADIREAPWQVALLYDTAGTGAYKFRCGGSIISTGTILTAGHCTVGTTSSRYKIRAGSSFHGTGGQLIQTSRVLTHPQYTPQYDFDIGIIWLSSPVILDGVYTKIIALPPASRVVPDNTKCFITGWGVTNVLGGASDILQKVHLPIVNQQACKNTYKGFDPSGILSNPKDFQPITERMICAGYLGVGGQDACKGDSGGPLVVNGELIGVTSWGRSCALADSPGVWAKVTVFLDWIKKNM